jgi:hypothetical protein
MKGRIRFEGSRKKRQSKKYTQGQLMMRFAGWADKRWYKWRNRRHAIEEIMQIWELSRREAEDLLKYAEDQRGERLR